jgi:4-amino-4-deoxy-L-arabinose transferase-like glycosyltransferase
MSVMSSQPGRRFPEVGVDLLLVAGLLILATVVRLPYLQLLPLLSDEAFEVLAALPITQGEWLLFGPVNPTAGPLVTYLMALGFWLFGPGVNLPRALMLILGVLTVGATYFLGRSMGGRKAGLIAGLLLACSPVHTIVNSHIAWSNSATPLFSTLAFAFLHASVRRQKGWLQVVGGLFYGLALQTHVSVVVVAPGLLVWFLARRDVLNWLRRPWPYLAGGAALLSYGNMIAYHLIFRGGGLANFEQHSYAWESNPTWISYWMNLKTMVGSVGRTLGGQVPRLEVPLGEMVAIVLLVWLVAALVYALWRRETMPVFVILSTALIMPYFNKRYEDLLAQRYTAFLLPLCFATMGLAAAKALEVLWRKRQPAARVLAVGIVILLLFLAVYPLRATLTYYAVETRAGRDNTLTLTTSRSLKDRLPSDTLLYLSSGVKGVPGDGGYRYLRAMYYYLTLAGVEHWVLDFPDLVARLEAEESNEVWLMLPPGDYEVLRAEFKLEPIEGAPPIPNDGILVRYVPPGREP